MALNMRPYVPVEAVFPDVHYDFRTFTSILRELDLTDALFWCAQANMILSHWSNDDRRTRQQNLLDRCLSGQELDRANDFIVSNGGYEGAAAFFRGQMLELLRWVALYSSDRQGGGKTFDDPQTRRRFAEAALMASDIWDRRVFGDRLSDTDQSEIGWRKLLGPSTRAYEATRSAPHISHTLGRGWPLFKDYFPRYAGTFGEDFLARTGLSVLDYYICLSAMMSHYMNPRSQYVFNWRQLGSDTPYADKFRKFLALESCSPGELREALWRGTTNRLRSAAEAPPYSYTPLRRTCILRAASGSAVILDPALFSERASVGPLFIPLRGKGRRESNQVFNCFGEAFERYACDILSRMFAAQSQILTRRVSLDVRGTTRTGKQVQVDACLNDVTEVVIFEMKAAFIREERMLSDNYEAVLQAVREKYGVTEDKDGKEKVKGVGQLARTVKLLATKQWLGEHGEFNEARVLYPVLVTHDPFVGTPVYGRFLASEFARLVEPDSVERSGDMIKGHLRILPLTVMTIEDLEVLETRTSHVALRDLLRDYSRSSPDRLGSLHDFIVTMGPTQTSAFLRDSAREVITKARSALFPEAPPRSGTSELGS